MAKDNNGAIITKTITAGKKSNEIATYFIVVLHAYATI